MGRAQEVIAKYSEGLKAIIKPTKQNVEALKKRGLFSDDSSKFFKLQGDIMDGKSFELDANDKYDKMIMADLTKAGVKF